MKEYKKIYFIGIGGIGMSALARMLKGFGFEVLGSDISSSQIIDGLRDSGIEVSLEQKAENIPDNVDCVIYTLAIDENNPEIKKAKELGVPMFTYAQMLGEVSKDKFTIAVSGTHGKTTATAMTADVFHSNGRKPYVIVGSSLNKEKTNYLKGEEEVFVVEACEYKKSFLNLNPNILIITNIEADHLDFYKDLEDVQSAFKELISKMPEDGIVICNKEDEKIKPVIKNISQKIVNYLDFVKDVPEGNIKGDHNFQNAACALALSDSFNLDMEKSKEAMKNFKGTWRRFEYKGETENGAVVYDDYAHHPSEIKATIKTALENFSDKKITVVFQSHTYSRTKALFDDFVEVLSGVEEVVLLPIYAAREEDDGTVSSEMLAKAISKKQNVKNFDSFEEVAKYLKSEKNSDDLIITMGAGDISKVGENILK